MENETKKGEKPMKNTIMCELCCNNYVHNPLEDFLRNRNPIL